MTENRALELDAAANQLAVVALCTRGPEDCAGRKEPAQPEIEGPPEPVMRRAAGDYREAGGLPGRRYVCRFCGTQHIFPVPPPEPEPAVAETAPSS